jgi:hypothetical protein
MIFRYNMVIEKKMTAAKLFCSSEEQLKEVKSITRWRCEVKIQMIIVIYEADLVKCRTLTKFCFRSISKPVINMVVNTLFLLNLK